MSRAEVRACTALWCWVRGRDADTELGAVVFRAGRGSFVLPAAFGIATLVEIGVLHLVLPWLWLRVVVAVLTVWSLLAMFGKLAVHRVHPHYLTDALFVMRQSGAIVAAIERSNIASVRFFRRFSETSPVFADNRLYLPNMDGTNVDITLTQPTSFRLPALLPRFQKAESVRHVSMYVDDPAALVTELQN